MYKRDSHFRAPKELVEVHPLGKSPVIEIPNTTGPSTVIAESGNIASYILDKYDTNNKLIPTDPNDKLQMNYFLHYSEGTLQPLLLSLMFLKYAKTKAPFGTRLLVGFILDGINNAYYKPELIKNFDYLEETLKKQRENNSNYFLGNKLSAADILLSFPVYTNFFSKNGLSDTFTKDQVEKWPHLKDWCEVIKNEPNFIKVQEMAKEHDR